MYLRRHHSSQQEPANVGGALLILNYETFFLLSKYKMKKKKKKEVISESNLLWHHRRPVSVHEQQVHPLHILPPSSPLLHYGLSIHHTIHSHLLWQYYNTTNSMHL